MWNIVFSRSNIWVFLELIRRWTQHFTKIDQEKCKIEQICIWHPMTTGFIMSVVHRLLSMGKPVISIQVVNFKYSLRVNKKKILGEYYSFFKPSMWYHYYTSTE